jgi:SAP domain-containing protein
MSKQLDLSKGIDAKLEADLRSRYSNEHVNWLIEQAALLKEEAELKEPASPADDEGEVPVSPSGDVYDDMTNEQLREQLEGRGLEKSGNKAELVARLREDDAS